MRIVRKGGKSMRREILNSRFLTILLILGVPLVIGGYYLFHPGRQTPPSRLSQTPISDNDSGGQSLPEASNQSVYRKLPTRIEVGHSHHPSPVGHSVTSTLPISAEVLEQIEVVSEKLPFPEGQKKIIALLEEDMDTLSIAKYLRARGWSDRAREYSESALAENPDSFEALLLWCQLRPPNQDAEREAGFRKLLEMNPNSVDALRGLGTVLYLGGQSEVALEYLEKASLLDPGRPSPILGFAYERLGEYDKALSTLKKSYKITRSPVELGHIRAIERGTPIFKQIKRETELRRDDEKVREDKKAAEGGIR
jgi:tetratricopeptide (TPR) repeat protein